VKADTVSFSCNRGIILIVLANCASTRANPEQAFMVDGFLRGILRLPRRRCTVLGFLQAIHRDRQVPLGVRMRAAIEALPFESPKLSASAVLTADDFATRLERAIARSGVAPKLVAGIEVSEGEA
jgi:hypothetical protein